jgi:hypothetical protein
MRDISENPQGGHQEFSIYVFGPFRLDAGRRRLLKDGEVMTVAPKVLDTLLLLVEHAGRVVSKEELLQERWPETFVEEANLTHPRDSSCSSRRKVVPSYPRPVNSRFTVLVEPLARTAERRLGQAAHQRPVQSRWRIGQSHN